ncbi:MAG: hypothetical protein M3444_03525 [Acidobacteriota bacterium]|nr:hypothetical protein [Acidobacteriota bacterium]MDQ5837998.1 hypothetical protein [Acidobacteriota bacterium]
MSPRPSKNEAWAELFRRHRILEEVERRGACQISSGEINELHEARLMTKFDHYVQLPEIFKRNRLTIQPNTRGTYLIGRFDSYKNVSDDPHVSVEGVPFPRRIETIDPANLYSESAVLMCAHHTGIISAVLRREAEPTVFGRHSAGNFDYLIRNNQTGELHEIKVEGAQLEIDAGFEAEDAFAIVEAKNETVKDFHVRQLYYPYRAWLERTNKRIVPVFLSYSNASSVFSLHVFRFREPRLYNSIELVEQRKFRVVPSDIGDDDIRSALGRVRVGPEPAGVPFPQADSFARVIDLLTQLRGASGALTQEYITSNYAFDTRQTRYYTDAARYLGLVERRGRAQGVMYALTDLGDEIMSRPPRERNLALVERLLERKVFRQTLGPYLERGARPSAKRVEEFIRRARPELTDDTIERRAKTVLSWADWVVNLSEQH